MADGRLIDLLVTSREGTVFKGDALSVTSYNEVGKFDVLYNHANFVTLIKDRLEITLNDRTRRDIPMKNGVLIVEANKAKVFVGVAKV